MWKYFEDKNLNSNDGDTHSKKYNVCGFHRSNDNLDSFIHEDNRNKNYLKGRDNRQDIFKIENYSIYWVISMIPKQK